MTTYKIIRFRQEGENETLVHGLTLDQAQAHCQRDDTRGDGWFDGYVAEDEDASDDDDEDAAYERRSDK